MTPQAKSVIETKIGAASGGSLHSIEEAFLGITQWIVFDSWHYEKFILMLLIFIYGSR